MALLAQVFKEARNQLLEREMLFEFVAGSSAHINAAAFAKVDPTTSREFAISGAHRVGVNVVTPGKVARARQTFADLEVVTDDAEDDLRDELFADRHFAVFGEPETHLV